MTSLKESKVLSLFRAGKLHFIAYLSDVFKVPQLDTVLVRNDELLHAEFLNFHVLWFSERPRAKSMLPIFVLELDCTFGFSVFVYEFQFSFFPFGPSYLNISYQDVNSHLLPNTFLRIGSFSTINIGFRCFFVTVLCGSLPTTESFRGLSRIALNSVHQKCFFLLKFRLHFLCSCWNAWVRKYTNSIMEHFDIFYFLSQIYGDVS